MVRATTFITGAGATGPQGPTPTDITGNAATATALQTARTINGVSFDGTANIVTRTTGNYVAVANANYTAIASDSVVVMASISATRQITLPAASAVSAGAEILIADISGSLTASISITVASAGSDTVNGGTSQNIRTPYGAARFVSDGTSKWSAFAVATVQDRTSVGWNAYANGANSAAFGNAANASGSGSAALGPQATASAGSTLAAGNLASASGTNGTALGAQSLATQNPSLAVGSAAAATGVSSVAIGPSSVASTQDALAVGKSASCAASASVVIGNTATITATASSSVVIGYGANSTDPDVLGGERVAIGRESLTTVWRGTAVGYKAKTYSVSATAVGRGSYVATASSHGIAVGRGAWVNTSNTCSIGCNGGSGQFDFYLNSGHTSKFVDTWADNVTFNIVPESSPIIIHGFDAYDATGTPTNNVAGGDLRLMAGRGTGTAVGGKVQIQTAPAGGASNNTKNTAVSAGEFDTNTTANETRFLLWDVTAGTLKRVSIGASDSGGAGYKVLRIPN